MPKVHFLAFLIGAAVVLGGCGSNTAPTKNIVNVQPIDAPKITEEDKEAFLEAINTARSEAQECGEKGHFEAADPLEWSTALYKAAYEHNDDMIKSGVVHKDHTGSGTEHDYTAQVQNLGKGSTFDQRIVNNGFTGAGPLLENLTLGTNTDTAKKAVEEWLKSDGHCANLMNPYVKKVGMSHLQNPDPDSEYVHYWTQDFGGQ